MLDNLNILIIAPVYNLSLLIDGLLIGAIFALTAYGLALVWGVMNVKNLAQGVFVMARFLTSIALNRTLSVNRGGPGGAARICSTI